jgi:hypothetical protein
MANTRKAAKGYAVTVVTFRGLQRAGITRRAQQLADRTLRVQERRRKRRRQAVIGGTAALATAAALTSAGLVFRHRMAGA